MQVRRRLLFCKENAKKLLTLFRFLAGDSGWTFSGEKSLKSRDIRRGIDLQRDSPTSFPGWFWRAGIGVQTEVWFLLGAEQGRGRGVRALLQGTRTSC